MSALENPERESGGNSVADITFLREGSSDTHTEPLSVDADADLVVHAPEDDTAPFRVAVTADGTDLLDTTGTEEFFARGSVARDRFATNAGRLVALASDATVSDAITAVRGTIDTVRERLISGDLYRARSETVRFLKEVDRVHFNPDTDEWTIVFDVEGLDTRQDIYTRGYFTVDAADWGTTNPAPKPKWAGLENVTHTPREGGALPDDIFNGVHGATRWETCRAVWARTVEVSTDPPALTVPLNSDAMKERNDVPGMSATLDRFVSLVEERDTLQKRTDHDRPDPVLDAIPGADDHHARRAVRKLGLTDELDDVEPR